MGNVDAGSPTTQSVLKDPLQYNNLANKEEYFRAYKNLVLFKFMFITYKRRLLKSCSFLNLEMP